MTTYTVCERWARFALPTLLLRERDSRVKHLPPPHLREMLHQELRQHLDAGGPRPAGRRDPMQRAVRLLPTFQDPLHGARRNRVSNDELRQVGDSEPREQRRHDSLAIVGAQRPAGPHACLFAGGIGVMPDVWRREIGVTEAAMLRE